jgi:hypothetical protein
MAKGTLARELSEVRSPSAMDPRLGSVVNMARILVAGGVRDRAIERTVREAAAAITSTTVFAEALMTKTARKEGFLPPLNASGLRRSSRVCGKQHNDKNIFPMDLNYANDATDLHVRSLQCPRSKSTVPPPTVRSRAQQFHAFSASQSPLPFPGAPAFKQTVVFADNDLSAPFRQDLSIKRPTLHLLVPADFATDKTNIRRGVLLQEALKQSCLLGPGHILAPIVGTQSSGPAALGAAFSSLSQKLSSKASSRSAIKRNFALA